MLKLYTAFSLLLLSTAIWAQQDSSDQQDYWQLTKHNSIRWDISQEKRLPHKENIEMAGKNVAAILYYTIDEERRLSIKRDVIFPQLRTFNRSNEPDWRKYRAYFRRSIAQEVGPQIHAAKKIIVPTQVDSIEIGPFFTIYHNPVQDLQITRAWFPSMEGRFLVEKWSIKNVGARMQKLAITNGRLQQAEQGYKGEYRFEVFSDAQETVELAAGASYSFPVYFGATLNEESSEQFDGERAEQERRQFLEGMQNNLILNSPDPILNQLFYFSKIRASESIFNSTMGLVHSPGGGNYYVGIWANDQIEYSGPFFPYLVYPTGQTAARNAYQWFQNNIPKNEGHIPYAFEVDGNFPMTHLDRGDAAMITYGLAHFLLASGDRQQAQQLWPLLEWSLDYCHGQRNAQGAVQSQSDEMEGRISTGDANLSTSSLYYGGLKYSARLARALNRPDKAKTYEQQAQAMAQVIEAYFGAELEGLATYKYFAENRYLRHWICLPLSMGISQRKEGTLNALFNKLWTENGILVEYRADSSKQTVFWDRATLYALQGALKVGATERAFDKLRSFSRKRLLGDHVPYVVEAYPENNMKHLSAESALYCRIFTEGLLGLEPLSFHQFQLRPRLPEAWEEMELRKVRLGGKLVDIGLQREGEQIRVLVKGERGVLVDWLVKPGEAMVIELNK